MYAVDYDGYYGSGFAYNAYAQPKGMTIYVAGDGSAKALDSRGKIVQLKQASDGSWYMWHPSHRAVSP